MRNILCNKLTSMKQCHVAQFYWTIVSLTGKYSFHFNWWNQICVFATRLRCRVQALAENNSNKWNFRRYSIDFWVPIIQIAQFSLCSILNTFWDAPQNFFFWIFYFEGYFFKPKKLEFEKKYLKIWSEFFCPDLSFTKNKS